MVKPEKEEELKIVDSKQGVGVPLARREDRQGYNLFEIGPGRVRTRRRIPFTRIIYMVASAAACFLVFIILDFL